MTFIVGLKCCDGIVICADSLESNGITKKKVNKVSLMGGQGWGVAIAGAGGGGVLDKLSAEVRLKLPRGEFDRRAIEETIEGVASDFRQKYSEKFTLIVGVYSNPTMSNLVYRWEGDGPLSPVTDEAHTGTAYSLWRFVSDSLFDERNSVADNSRVAFFATQLAIRYSDGVGGPIQLVSHTFGDELWSGLPKMEMWRLEHELSADSAEGALRKHWKTSNPPSQMDQLFKFRGKRTPGDELTFLDGVKVEELKTVSGRKKASNSFFCNRGRLHKHAILERDRGQ